MNEMTLSPRAVNMLRVSMAKCEKAIGTEYADVYTAKHIATLETILELAEDSNVGQVSITPFVAVNASQESVRCGKAASPVNLDEDVEEVADESDPPKRKRTDVDHEVIRKMLSEGVTVNEISKRTGVGISTIYKIKKMQRDMEAK